MPPMNQPGNPWFLYRQPLAGADVRLFCFPYAGRGASLYRDWHNGLPTAIQVCPVQLPGRENRFHEAPIARLSALVDLVADALTPYLEEPYALFGHSMGALVSFESARRLRRLVKREPVHLFVSGRRAPQLPDPDPPVSHLPDAALIERLRDLHGTPEDVLANREMLDLLLPMLRCDFALCETYRYVAEDPLSCPITVFGGSDDDRVAYDALTPWRAQSTGRCAVRLFAGDHFFIESAQGPLLAAIRASLVYVLCVKGRPVSPC
jgi:medium-chain acyl-[acyl-carrier-protein] hydrolase